MPEYRYALSITATLDRLDYNISQKVAILRQMDRNSKSFRVLNTLTRIFEIIGSAATTIPATLILTIWYGGVQPSIASIFLNATILQLLNTCVTACIKGVVKRERPGYSQNGDMYLTRWVDMYSFPSGHAVQMLTLARFCILYIADPVLKWGLTTLFGVITFLRVFTGRHFLGDVIGGSLLGWYMVSLYTAFFWVDSTQFF
eukprot:sb/3470675/